MGRIRKAVNNSRLGRLVNNTRFGRWVEKTDVSLAVEGGIRGFRKSFEDAREIASYHGQSAAIGNTFGVIFAPVLAPLYVFGHYLGRKIDRVCNNGPFGTIAHIDFQERRDRDLITLRAGYI